MIIKDNLKDRFNYWRRIFRVYLGRETSYLSFWHEHPAVSPNLNPQVLGPYYMTFEDKAAYAGPKDKSGVIMFDYFFDIGRQYNPLAVAQYGLGHWNLYFKNKNPENLARARAQADWLVSNLEKNDSGLMVWKHKFRWHYKKYLAPGWYSAHAQGAGISLLARLYKETGEKIYLQTAAAAFPSLNTQIKDGGVKYIDEKNNTWLEEYLIESPTHILNGFLWAFWGVWDFFLLVRYAQEEKTLSRVEGLQLEKAALELWNACLKTLEKNLPRYDISFWSLYDLSKQALKMVASGFYHRLHIVQLKITNILSGEDIFKEYAERFEKYQKSFWCRWLAFIYKAVFKIFYF